MITFNLQGAGDEMVKPVKVKTVFNKVNSNDYGQAKFTGNLTDFFSIVQKPGPCDYKTTLFSSFFFLASFVFLRGNSLKSRIGLMRFNLHASSFFPFFYNREMRNE